MTDKQRTSEHREASVEADAIAELLELTGSPVDPPPEVAVRVHDTVHGEWQHRVELRAGRRRLGARLALAAALALAAVGLVTLRARSPVTLDSLAVLERISGDVRFSAAGTRVDLAAVPGQAFGPGATVETGTESRIALRLASGASVRIDAGSTVRLESLEELALESGGVYIDSAAGPPLSVRTPLGIARDIGTRFEVRVFDESLRMRVREGTVELEVEAGRYRAESGEDLAVSSTGDVERQGVSGFSPVWGWALDIAPPYRLEGRTLSEWLEWLSAETGWSVRYAHETLRQEARSTILHGSIVGFRPDETPGAVLPTCGLTYTLEQGVLTLAREGA